MNAPPPPPPLPPVPPPLPLSGGQSHGHTGHPLQHQSSNNSITTLSKLNPTTVILTHIPPFLRHPRNLRDLLYSTTSIKHLFYSCPIKRFSNDNGDDDKNENVVAVVKFTHSGNALSIIRNWMNVQRKLNQGASAASANKKNGTAADDTASSKENTNGGELSYCKMNAFLLYSDGHISLHPEKSQVDAGMIESIWELTHKQRDTATDTGKVAKQADNNMIQMLVDAYRSIEKRQKELDIVAASNEGDAAASSNGGGIGSNPNDDNHYINDVTTMSEEETKLKLDSAKVRAAAGGGAYDDEVDPLNAPEVLEAVKQFKKKLEITQGGFRRKRKEYVAKRLKEEVKKAKERLIQQRKAKIMMEQQQQQQLPPPPLPPMGLPPPPIPLGGMPPPPQEPIVKVSAQDTGRRGVSNLPAWMTKNKNNDNDDDGKKRSVGEITESGNSGVGEDEPSRKRKFIPSEANRDINARKERLVVGGEDSLAAIRAANEAADKEKALKEEIQEYLKQASAFSDEQILTGVFPRLYIPETIPTMRSFVKEQMIEYLGEEEATLIDFIMKYLVKHDSSSSEDSVKGKAVAGLLEEMKTVLDEDADPFVVDVFKKIVELESKE